MWLCWALIRKLKNSNRSWLRWAFATDTLRKYPWISIWTSSLVQLAIPSEKYFQTLIALTQWYFSIIWFEIFQVVNASFVLFLLITGVSSVSSIFWSYFLRFGLGSKGWTRASFFSILLLFFNADMVNDMQTRGCLCFQSSDWVVCVCVCLSN